MKVTLVLLAVLIGAAAWAQDTSVRDGDAEKVTAVTGDFVFYIPDYIGQQSARLISPEQADANKKVLALMESQASPRPVKLIFPIGARESLWAWMNMTYGLSDLSFLETFGDLDRFTLDRTADGTFVIDVTVTRKAPFQLTIVVMTYEYFKAFMSR